MGKSKSQKIPMKYEKLYKNLHLREVQLEVLKDNKFKAGIYMILNKIDNKKYVGSAVTNRIHVRFRNHFFNGTGSKLTAKAVAQYGVENFEFYILEYFPGFVKKENLSSAHLVLLQLETNYIQKLKPEYNILGCSLGYNHSDVTLKDLERDQERYLKRDKERDQERKQLLSKLASLRKSNLELKTKLSLLASKPVTIYNKDNSVHSKYRGIGVMAKTFKCCNKTINRAIKNQTVFRNIGIIKFDQK
jgi:group I intron endonuclease